MSTTTSHGLSINDDLIRKFLTEASRNKEGLKRLKDTAVACQQYELAAELRQLENEQFPEQQHEKEAKEAQLLFRMVDINVEEPKTAWLILKVVQSYIEKGGDYDIDSAAKLETEAKKLFSPWQYAKSDGTKD